MKANEPSVTWNEIEQPAGPPLVRPVDRAGVEAHRREAYLSYEQFLRKQLADLDRARPGQWQRDYSSIEAYERSIAPMRQRLCRMLGFWVEPSQRRLSTRVGARRCLMSRISPHRA